MRIVRRADDIRALAPRARARGVARYFDRQRKTGMPDENTAQLPSAHDHIDRPRPGRAESLVMAHRNRIAERSCQIVLVVEKRGTPLRPPVVKVLRIGSGSGGLTWRTVIPLRVGHTLGIGVAHIIFQAQG